MSIDESTADYQDVMTVPNNFRGCQKVALFIGNSIGTVPLLRANKGTQPHQSGNRKT
jgi:hypothetical protein